jgi:PLD-like domain
VVGILAGMQGGAGCDLAVAMSAFSDSRPALVDELVRIAAAGCSVRVAYASIGAQACTRLAAVPQIELRRVDSTLPGGRHLYVHSKYMLYRGIYAGVAARSLVWTGSHTWEARSLRLADEILIRMEDQETYDRYRTADFDDIVWPAGTPIVSAADCPPPPAP